MSNIGKIEARAAAMAIHKTVRKLEKAFGVRARGSTPKAKRASVMRQLQKKFGKKNRK